MTLTEGVSAMEGEMMVALARMKAGMNTEEIEGRGEAFPARSTPLKTRVTQKRMTTILEKWKMMPYRLLLHD